MNERELREQYNQLSEQYHRTECNMFHYNEYLKTCTGRPLSPYQLHQQREELFREMSNIWRQLPHEQQKRGLDRWL